MEIQANNIDRYVNKEQTILSSLAVKVASAWDAIVLTISYQFRGFIISDCYREWSIDKKFNFLEANPKHGKAAYKDFVCGNISCGHLYRV